MNLKKWLANAAVNPPPVPAQLSDGYPTDGDASSGVQAATPGAYLFYQILEEFRHLIEDEAGIVPNHEDLTQMALAIRTLVNGAWQNIQVFDASGTFNVPTDVTRVFVEAWGGGGGGQSAGPGGGGGGGEYAASVVSVTPNDAITVTVGAQGAADGGSGGQSSFGNFVIANGGGGGTAGPGGGGNGGTGQILINGQTGQDVISSGNPKAAGGDAGGPGGSGGHLANGVRPGGGGGADDSGGEWAGAAGRIIVRW